MRNVADDGSNPNKTALVLADKLLLVDTETNPDSLKEVELTNLLKVINLLSVLTPDMAADYLLSFDTSEATVKKLLLSTLLSGLGVPVSWTPTWTNLTPGNGVQSGRYTQIGKLVHFDAGITWGTTTSIPSGNVTLILPVVAATYSPLTPIGVTRYKDATGGVANSGVIFSSGILAVLDSSGTYATGETVTNARPYAWAVNDELSISGTYIAA